MLIAEPHARLASVFMMFDEMNPSTNAVDKSRRFNLTISDLSHWSGLPGDVVRDEVNKFVEKRRMEVFDTYIIVKNIVDMKRVAK